MSKENGPYYDVTGILVLTAFALFIAGCTVAFGFAGFSISAAFVVFILAIAHKSHLNDKLQQYEWDGLQKDDEKEKSDG